MTWRLWIEQASAALPSATNAGVSEVVASFAVLLLIVGAYWSHGWAHGNTSAPLYPRLSGERGGVLFRRSLMNVGYWFLQPIGRALHSRGVSANTITTIGLVLAIGASAAIVFGRLGLAGVLLLAAALCDALDGLVARLGKTTSAGGAVYDAFTDRVEEILVFSAIAFSARSVTWVASLSIFAMVASLMNSYVSAKAEVFKVQIPSGRMRRGERAAWVILGCLVAPLAELTSPLTHLDLSCLPLVICLGVIALGTVTSATVRAVALIDSLGLRARSDEARHQSSDEVRQPSAARPLQPRNSRPGLGSTAVHLLAAANKGDLRTR